MNARTFLTAAALAALIAAPAVAQAAAPSGSPDAAAPAGANAAPSAAAPAAADPARQAEAAPRVSLDIGLSAGYAYKQTVGSAAPEAHAAYAPMISFSYLAGPNTDISLVLLKFSHYPLSQAPVYNFAYGFEIRHHWHREWGDLGVFDPWLSYGILLSWVVVADRAGAAIGHDTRIALGTDIVTAPRGRFVVQVAWENASYPALDSSFFDGQGSFSLGIGYRFLF